MPPPPPPRSPATRATTPRDTPPPPVPRRLALLLAQLAAVRPAGATPTLPVPATGWSYADTASWGRTWPACGPDTRSGTPFPLGPPLTPAPARRLVPAYRAASFIATSPSSVNTIFGVPPAGTIDPASGAAGGVTVVDDEGRATRYSLLQFHFHRPAEEVLPGARGDRRLIGIHLVHEVADPGDGGDGGGGFGRPRDAGRLLVVAASLEAGDAGHPALAAALAALGPDGKPAAVAARTPPIDPRAFLPSSVDGGSPLFWYEGGLTTPPCTPGVDWVVCGAATGSATQAQAAGLGREDNARPLQGRGGRRVYVSGGGGGST